MFEYDITALANTTEENAQRLDVTLPAGILDKIEIQFPTGCAGLAHARVKHGIVSILPRNDNASVKGDGSIVTSRENIHLVEETNKFELYVWNEDSLYDHTLTFRLHVNVLTKNETLQTLKSILYYMRKYVKAKT